MTLRSRLAALVVVLLAVVLTVVSVVLVRLDARDTERRLGERALDRARVVGRLEPARDETRFTAPPPDDAARVDSFPLAAEPDGARLTAFRFGLRASTEATPGENGVVRAEATNGTGPPPIEAKRAMGHLPAAGARPDERTFVEVVDGTEWQVAVVAAVTVPPPPDGRRGRRGPSPDGPPPPRRPPPPPPGPDVIVAYLETAPERAAHDAFVLRTALTCLAALGVGGLLAWIVAGRALKPVGALAAAAARIGGARERLPEPATRDEVARLASLLNGMLGRLDAASERERAFLATASHELRRPLSALLGELELAGAPGRDAAALRESVRLAHGDARAMARLVEDLLHHARARAGTLRLAPGPADLREVVDDAVERSRRALGGALRAETRDVPSATVEVDVDALRRVVENLVVNAATHGGSDVTVRVRGRVDGPDVEVAVEDDGAGIPPDEIPRLFEPFGRGDRARAMPGFGLGLAIVRDLVEAHGGRVEVTSPAREGAARPGARFTVRLPRARPDPGTPPS